MIFILRGLVRIFLHIRMKSIFENVDCQIGVPAKLPNVYN